MAPQHVAVLLLVEALHLAANKKFRNLWKKHDIFLQVTAIGRSSRNWEWTWPRSVAIAFVLASSLLAPLTSVAGAAAATAAPTTSYYEQSASAPALYLQGEAAGQAGTQGIVILDFGRPASDGTSDGSLGFAHRFLSFAAISKGVESYIMGYYNYAPANTTIDVAVGTNDSCGMYQPCGAIVCGCPDEPNNYITWGQEFADAVEQLGAWSSEFGSSNGYSDTVRVVAGDDVEPAFDPGFNNTYHVMEGYAQAVGDSYPAMVDFGSADPGIWSEDQLLQVANGFSPNVAMPEIYNPAQVGEWAALVAYAKARYGETVTVFGVLTEAAGTAQNAVVQTLGAVSAITGQNNIPWASSITH
jgi:hypothetical protein